MVMHEPSVFSRSTVVPGGRPESAHRLRNPMVVEDDGDALATEELVLVYVGG
jgi:hypothetical protein